MNKAYWMNIIMLHLNKYPLMTVQDIAKLIHQACFGPKHFNRAPSMDQLETYLIKELDTIKIHHTTTIELIGNDYYRVYLQVLVDKKVDLITLNKSFYASMMDNVDFKIASNMFDQVFDYIVELVERRQLPFSLFDVKAFLDNYRHQDYPALHHSEVYQRTYDPHYRVIHKKHLTFV